LSEHSFFAELKRRNVLRAAAFYAAGAWLVAQVAGLVLPAYHAEDWVLRWIISALAVGFPFWLLFAWYYEMTPEGIRRESEIEAHESIAAHTGKRMDRWIIAILSLAVVLLLTDRFVLRQGANQTPAAAVPEKSIAVLPFANMSDDKSNEYFSDGISEELLNLLARVPQLEVTARTSSFAFKGKELSVPEIARKLNVAHVLEGSVRKAGNSVRVTAQLVDAASDRHVWSKTWDRKLDDIFAIQDEIATDVVQQLQVTLLGAAPKSRMTDPEAYALYLQAGHLTNLYSAESIGSADALYRRVLELDPRYAPAWADRGRNLIAQVGAGLLPEKDGIARARDAYGKALEIDPDLAVAHSALGYLAGMESKLADAARHLGRALALDPTNTRVQLNAASLLSRLGRHDEAIALDLASTARDPLNSLAYNNLGAHQRSAGRYDESIESFRTALTLSPGRRGPHAGIAQALFAKGDAAGALMELELEPNELSRLNYLPAVYHALGRKAESDAALADLIRSDEQQQDAAMVVAGNFAFRGDADLAFAWLGKAIERRDTGLSNIDQLPLFAKVHGDPRWLPFLQQIGRTPEQLAAIPFDVSLPVAGGARR